MEAVIVLLACVFALAVGFYIWKFNLSEEEPKLHWYRIKFTYKDKQGNTLFSWTGGLGLRDQADILNHRLMKQGINKPWLFDRECKDSLCNGTIQAEPKAYLGYFAKKKKALERKEQELRNSQKVGK